MSSSSPSSTTPTEAECIVTAHGSGGSLHIPHIQTLEPEDEPPPPPVASRPERTKSIVSLYPFASFRNTNFGRTRKEL